MAVPRCLSRFGDGGFSLLEVMAALALLTGSLLLVARLMIVGERVADRARECSLAVLLAWQKLEQMKALAWGFDVDGSELRDTQSDLSRWPTVPTGGSGLSSTTSSTLTATTAGSADYLDRSGRWVGAGAAPPAGSVFVRRWSIEDDAAVPGTRVLRVGVWRLPPPSAGAGGGLPLALLQSAKAARAQ
jgi:prepilin-type N-terminal cleavage/methylation domain-containing protein